jgi:hypothetical protein
MTSLWKIKSHASTDDQHSGASDVLETTVEDRVLAEPYQQAPQMHEPARVDHHSGGDVAEFPSHSSVKIVPNQQTAVGGHGPEVHAGQADQVSLEAVQAEAEMAPAAPATAPAGVDWMDDNSRLGKMVGQIISAQVQDWLDEHLMELAEVRIQEMLETYFRGD